MCMLTDLGSMCIMIIIIMMYGGVYRRKRTQRQEDTHHHSNIHSHVMFGAMMDGKRRHIVLGGVRFRACHLLNLAFIR